MNFEGKHTAILGLGASGEAAARLLLGRGARVTLLDASEAPAVRQRAEQLAGLGARAVLGAASGEVAAGFDLAVLSPGIDAATPFVQRLASAGVPVWGEIELAFRFCECPVVAITGTNGKTTTTELTAALLKRAGWRVQACGNIGLPFSEAVVRSRALDALVVEVSSFQLETVHSFRPRVAVWTNFSANHLDRYAGLAEYRAAKLRIFGQQTGEDHAVVNARENLPPLRARLTTFSAFTDKADFTLREDTIAYGGSALLSLAETRLRGPHNAENLMAALGAGLRLGLDPQRMVPAARHYTPPPHRCEWVAEIDGVAWINDSKSTNLDALEQAIRSRRGGIVLLAGGKDKGFGFEPLADLVRERVRAAVLIGEMRHRIAAVWQDATDCRAADSLEAAVRLCGDLAQPGETVLFSPGTSSFDMFRSYEARGQAFKQLVQQLHQSATTQP